MFYVPSSMDITFLFIEENIGSDSFYWIFIIKVTLHNKTFVWWLLLVELCCPYAALLGKALVSSSYMWHNSAIPSKIGFWTGSAILNWVGSWVMCSLGPSTNGVLCKTIFNIILINQSWNARCWLVDLEIFKRIDWSVTSSVVMVLQLPFY